jgi:hypothetical protein
MRELIPMYRIENILARNISKTTVIKRSTMRFQPLLNPAWEDIFMVACFPLWFGRWFYRVV